MRNNDKLKRIAGAQIYNNLPMEKVEDFKILYHTFETDGEGEIISSPLVTSDGARLVKVALVIDGRNYIGEAKCSKHDNFDKKKGRKIALIRACKQFWGHNYVI
ncbi:MAG: hypothetical protein HOG49_19450 [Candidatus Scalindua sp.]|jgi:hypothetical protein|nr:hypothetical protein [Candidatus Scalindua sp.]